MDPLKTILKGTLDSLKGFYWLYQLDYQQRNAHSNTKFQEIKKKSHTPLNKKEEPRLLQRVLQCCTLNGFVFGLSIIFFNHLLLPFLKVVLDTEGEEQEGGFWFWLSFLLKWTFDGLWVLPLFILSRVVNALWFQDIATLSYRYSVGRPVKVTFSTLIADNLFSFVIQAFFLVQALLLSMATPYLLGNVLSNVIFLTHMCLLYSLYSFEYKWINQGMPLHQRLTFLETNWPYFLGYGLPLSLLTFFPGDFVISGCLFAIFFPCFVVASNEAEVSIATNVPRLKLFSFVVLVANGVFKFG